MIKLFRFALPISVFLIILSISGCESGGLVSEGASVIKGRVMDSTTSNSISGATITTLPETSTILSDSVGNYTITGLSAGTFTVTAVKSGYYSRSITIDLADEDTATVNLKMFFTNVFTYGPITVDEYFGDTSYSGVNVYLGRAVTEIDNANKDIQMRDSAGTSSNFYFRSGDLAKLMAGKETKFTDLIQNPSGGYDFTKVQFDSLKTIYNGKILDANDFPMDRTMYFNSPLSTRFVFGVFLKGRNLLPPVYGLVYVEALYFDNGMYHARIYIKTNRNGTNLFTQNP